MKTQTVYAKICFSLSSIQVGTKKQALAGRLKKAACPRNGQKSLAFLGKSCIVLGCRVMLARIKPAFAGKNNHLTGKWL